jgi:hypothetical protein
VSRSVLLVNFAKPLFKLLQFGAQFLDQLGVPQDQPKLVAQFQDLVGELYALTWVGHGGIPMVSS